MSRKTLHDLQISPAGWPLLLYAVAALSRHRWDPLWSSYFDQRDESKAPTECFFGWKQSLKDSFSDSFLASSARKATLEDWWLGSSQNPLPLSCSNYYRHSTKMLLNEHPKCAKPKEVSAKRITSADGFLSMSSVSSRALHSLVASGHPRRCDGMVKPRDVMVNDSGSFLWPWVGRVYPHDSNDHKCNDGMMQ